ncbi:MAG: acyl-CoA dehydrogenase family protein [Oceanicoccus sp.]
MNLDLNTEQTLLKNSAKSFLKEECPSSLIREVRESDQAFPQKLWKDMADMGWMGLGIDEKYEGIGGSASDVAVLMEAMGEVSLPAPFFTTVVVSGTTIQQSSNEEIKTKLLPLIVAGQLISSFALIEPNNEYGLTHIRTTATADGSNWIFSGTKLFVEYAKGAHYFLTVASVEGSGLIIAMIDATTDGIELKSMPTLDYSKQCEVVFNAVKVPAENILAVGEDAELILKHLEDICAVAKCSEMMGAIQSVLDVSVEYAKDRTQFGQPIGGFQAIQHHCANMAVDVDSARYLTGLAAWKLSQGMPATKEASMAKAFVSKAAVRISKLGHQIHGAISFCDEHDMHLYLRRSQSASMAFGSSEYHLEKVARQIGL